MDRNTDRPLLGIDLGGTKILAGVVDAKGQIAARAKRKTRADQGADQVLKRIVKAAHDAVEEAGLAITDLAGAGIGAPGQIDFKRGEIVYAPNLGWEGFPLRDRLAQALGIPVALDNDVNVAALAEQRWGAGRGARDLVAISVGTGIGAGIILGGELHHGVNGTAGEIGHTVIDLDGPKWPPSNRGCLESIASRTAIAGRLAKAVAKGAKTALPLDDDGELERVRSGLLAAAAAEDDELVLGELTEAARVIGIAVGNVINFLNPEVIILGGGVIEACGDLMMPLIRERAERTAIANAAEGVRIVQSQLGDDAGLLGAAALVTMC